LTNYTSNLIDEKQNLSVQKQNDLKEGDLVDYDNGNDYLDLIQFIPKQLNFEERYILILI